MKEVGGNKYYFLFDYLWQIEEISQRNFTVCM